MSALLAFWPSLAGGMMIGLSAAMLWLSLGCVAGISGIAGGLIGLTNEDTPWRLAFVAGLVLGPVAYLVASGHEPMLRIGASWPVLAVAGLLVGFGTRLGSGVHQRSRCHGPRAVVAALGCRGCHLHGNGDADRVCRQTFGAAAVKLWAALLAGLPFGTGLAVSGMLDPTRVLGFLNVTGAWDPSLAFVLGGAVGVSAVGQILSRRVACPLLAGRFDAPTTHRIDLPLLCGSALFGIGWGLADFCPGPALASLSLGVPRSVVFVGAMLAGMRLYRVVRPLRLSPCT